MDAKTDGRAAHTPRVEDDILVRGKGRYAADVTEPGQAYAYFVRSPHAFARIVGVDIAAASGAAGVLGVLTAKDMEGIASLGRHPPLAGRGGKPLILPHRPPLAGERAVHIGEPVAMVVAETASAAQDAAELVAIEYEPLTPVIDARAALAPGAPQVWPEIPGNLAIDWPGLAQDPEANARRIDDIFASARFVARIAVTNQRMAVASMEPRGATARYDAATDGYTLRVCSQGTTAMRDPIAVIMQIPKERLRVLTDDVGGAFGLKTGPYPEYIAQLVAAKKLGRPVHWMSSRSEAFLSDNQARDLYSEAELALDENGRFLALRIRNTANLGAYVGAVGANIPTLNFARCLPALYDIKHIDISARCAFTNTIATAPYRGAGRPEANYVLERVVEEAARVSGLDPATLRRRNLIPASAMPFRTAVGTTYDSGDFRPIFDKALALADYDGFKAGRREARRRGKYRGIGLSCMLEHSGGSPLEGAWLTFPGDGTLIVNLNVQSTGQGHASVFPRLIAERLGIAADKVRHHHGDFGLGDRGLRIGRLALGDDGWRLDRQMHRSDDRERKAHRGRLARNRRKRHRLRARRLRHRRHRPAHAAVRSCRPRRRAEERRRHRRRPRHQDDHRDAAHLSERRACGGGRNRSRHRPHANRRLHHGRRLRRHARCDDRRGSVARRTGAGARPGADGADFLDVPASS